MLRKHWRLTGVVVFAGLALCLGALASRQVTEKETLVSIDRVPLAVRATLLGQGGAIGEIEMQTENGQTVYEADVTINGQPFEVKVAADGSLISKESDDEDNEEDGDDEEEDADEEEENGEQLSIDQVLDPAVKDTILREAQGGTIKEIERGSENGQIIYEADVVISGQEVELKIAPDSGKLISKEIDDEEADGGDED